MQLQNKQHNQELQSLILKANEATTAFNQLQDKATEFKTNIDRNKKMIETLQNENAALQAKSDKVTISETGEVDFSEFDDFSNQIFANNRKIKALEKVVEKFESELELLVLTDYHMAANKADVESEKALAFYGGRLLDELFNEEIVNKLNTIYSVFRMSGERNAIDLIISSLKVRFDGEFKADINSLNLPFRNFRYLNENNIFLSQRRIVELKRKLGKEE